MDAKKWKSIAVRSEDLELIKALAKMKHRTPNLFLIKLVHEYVDFQSKKEKLSVDKYKEKVLGAQYE
tara:strand:+ start:3907 stop:4107 length:201 start_codon:yes stop_codon:yes gene_type:complete